MRNPVIVWFRQDLRLADNPALNAAADTCAPLIPLYILDDEPSGRWRLGAASRWWLHHSLTALGAGLRSASANSSRASPLTLRRGNPCVVLREICAQTGAKSVFWSRCYESSGAARDAKVKTILQDQGVEARSFGGSLLAEPESLRKASGDSYSVFTPFLNKSHARKYDQPLSAPRSLKLSSHAPASDYLDEWKLLPRIDWAAGLRASWRPGEHGAMLRLNDFIDETFEDYRSQRNRPDVVGTSRLSPHLHFGEISARQVWHAVHLTRAVALMRSWRQLPVRARLPNSPITCP